MSVPPPLSATDAFALIMERLCQIVAAQSYRERMAAPLILLIWTRLRRLGGAVRRPRRPGPRRHPPLTRSRAPRRVPPGIPSGLSSAASSAKRLRLARPARGAGGGRLRVAVAASPDRSGVRGAHRRRAADGAGVAPALPDAGRRTPPLLARPSRSAAATGRAPAPDQIQPDRIQPGRTPADPPAATPLAGTPGRSPGPRRERVRAVLVPAPLGLARA